MQNELNAHIKALVADINTKIAEHDSEAKELTKLLQALQRNCKHEFTNTGRDHNYQYETCTICTIRRKE